jgi:hypothetical protein
MIKGVHLKLYFGLASPSVAPPDVLEALQSVQVSVSTSKKSGFQMVFSTGKRSRLVHSRILGGFFDPPQRVVIAVIIKGSEHVLMDGVITAHEFSPSNLPGQARFTITGEDLTRMMDLVDLTGIPYPAVPVDGRVLGILAKYAPLGVVPKVIPSVLIADIPDPLDAWPMQNGTDLAYITSLAKSAGYVFYIEPGPEPGTSVAYWGPEIKTGRPQDALIVNSDAANNAELSSITFNGFGKVVYLILIQNAMTKIPIPIPVPDITPINPPLGRKLIPPLRIEPLRGLAKFTPLQAAAVGLAETSKAADVISGEGSLDVLRYGRILKARQLVNLQGAGEHLNGSYYVASVTHNIKPGQYKQSFTLSKNAFYPRRSTGMDVLAGMI